MKFIFFNHIFLFFTLCTKLLRSSILTIIPAFTHFRGALVAGHARLGSSDLDSGALLLRDPHISPAACTFRRVIAHNNNKVLKCGGLVRQLFLLFSLQGFAATFSLSYEDDDEMTRSRRCESGGVARSIDHLECESVPSSRAILHAVLTFRILLVLCVLRSRPIMVRDSGGEKLWWMPWGPRRLRCAGAFYCLSSSTSHVTLKTTFWTMMAMAMELRL